MTPDFAEFLRQTPEAERVGRVFRVDGLTTGQPMSSKRVSRTVTRIGRKAGVVVSRQMKMVKEGILDKAGQPTGQTRLVEREVAKYGSCHDFRRSFGTRWAMRVRPPVLQALMRHSSIETTLTYYVAIDADDIGDELDRVQSGDDSVGLGNTLGNIGPDTPQETGKGSRRPVTENPSNDSSYECGGQGTRTLNR